MIAETRQTQSPIAASELVLRSDGSLYHLGILPEHIAPKVIIVGDPERVPKISKLFDHIEFQVQGREFIVHTGVYRGKRITVISSGIGVDNIDIVINELDAAVNIDLNTRMVKADRTALEIVRIGTCGTLQADIPVGSIVASSFAFGLDGVPYSYSARHTTDEEDLYQALKRTFPWLAENPQFYVSQANADLLQRIAGDCTTGVTATANGFYGPQGRSLRLQSVMEPRIDAYSSFQWEGNRIVNFEMECAGIYSLATMLGHKPLTLCVILANRVTKEFHNNPSASVESLIRIVLDRF